MTYKGVAICKIHPNVRIVRGDIAYDENENEVSYDNNAVLLEASLIELREKRNLLLSQSDWIVTKAKETGTTIPTAWKTYRQALRDITENLTTVEEVNAVVFPDKP